MSRRERTQRVRMRGREAEKVMYKKSGRHLCGCILSWTGLMGFVELQEVLIRRYGFWCEYGCDKE